MAMPTVITGNVCSEALFKGKGFVSLKICP